MLRLREYGTERLKDPVEPVLVFRGTNGRHGRLGADQELNFRDDVDDNLATRTERREQLLPPGAKVSILFGEELSDEALECLDQCAVGNVPSELVEFSRNEVAATGCDRLVDFIDERRLADA